MQPLISTHFFLQKLTIFLLLCGEYLGFFKSKNCCSVLCHHFLPFFSQFSLPNTSVACAQSITLRIFKGVKCLHLVNSFIHLSCQTTFRAYLQSSGIASGDDMFCLTRLENKVLKEQLAAKDAKKKQKSISHFFQKS